jgi:hypothetical protein
MHRNRLSFPRIAACAALLALAAVLATRGASQEAQHSYVPPTGFVPDAETASAIAEAVLAPIYGQRRIARQKPLTASLHGDRWIVMGHLPPNTLGGVAEVEIAKSDARILRVTHGR